MFSSQYQSQSIKTALRLFLASGLHKGDASWTETCLNWVGSSANSRLIIYSQPALCSTIVTVKGIRAHTRQRNACCAWRQHAIAVSFQFLWPYLGSCSCFVSIATGVKFRSWRRNNPEESASLIKDQVSHQLRNGLSRDWR